MGSLRRTTTGTRLGPRVPPRRRRCRFQRRWSGKGPCLCTPASTSRGIPCVWSATTTAAAYSPSPSTPTPPEGSPLVLFLDSCITVYFFAQEDDDSVLKATKENLLQPVTVNFKEGKGQEFKQPSGTGIDLSMFEESELTKVGEDGVFPVAFKVEVDVSSNQDLEREQDAEDSKSLAKFAVFVKKDNTEYGIQVVQQILWVNGTRYVLQEIYGIGNRNTADKNVDEDDSGKECVVCLTEPRDTTVLPCRHMCLCMECAQLVRFQTNKCPICRQPIERLLEIEFDSKPMPHQGD
ncbi:hypothetical protein QYE76_064682 [Lolium multiflorum]|uniref:RING-type E3 ubiquitin transferase n=1 Tax=Lolium multiflorum TaxID=4521 RepID=A0AAD8WAG2_LOLMU|nr:hypothetical protein QYE76_064682 [Lolium multiflorum]